VPTVFIAGAGAGIASTGAGAEASGAGVAAAGATVGDGGATTTGAAVLSVACARSGVEDKAITAAIAVIAGRSGERFCFIVPDQFTTCRGGLTLNDESPAI